MLDYVRFTLPDEVGIEGVHSLLGAEGWVELERGALGYRSMRTRGHVKLFSDGNAGMGVHVEMTGKACREVEAGSGFTWEKLLSGVLDKGGHFTRVDWANDDRSGRLDLETVAAAAAGRAWVSRWKSARVTREVEVASAAAGPVEHLKVTFGKRGSDAYLRFYNKAAQMAEEGHWIRCELELRDERATASVRQFLAGGTARIVGILRGYLTFVEPGTATRQERATPCAWWLEFLDHAATVRLQVAPVVRSFHEVARWVQRQVAPSLALLWEGLGVEEFFRIVQDGTARLKPWHRELLQGVSYGDRVHQLSAA